MRARLFAKTGELAGSSFEIGGEATLGRLPENQIVLPGGLVSGRHGRIFFDAGQGCFFLEDLGSRNGTFLAGSRIREPEKLGRLDVINIAGAFDLIFQVVEEAAPEQPPEPLPATPAPAPAAARGTLVDREGAALPPGLAARGTLVEQPMDWVLPALPPAAAPAPPQVPRFALQVEREGATELFDLPPGEHLLGRAEDCAIAIDDGSLSRKHARLIVEGERVCVVDLGSTNRTYAAGERIFPDVLTRIEPGAQMLFGGVKAVLVRHGVNG